MKRRISMVALLAIATLNMGQSCRQETLQSVIATFLTEVASVTGEAIGNTLVDERL